MCWGQRKDLLSNPDNIETADWKQIPNTGRRLIGGRTPTRVSAADVFQQPRHRGRGERPGGADRRGNQAGAGGLAVAGEAAPVCGRYRRIGDHASVRNSEPTAAWGFAPSAIAASARTIRPRTWTLERVSIVKEFMELWADSLHAARRSPREDLLPHRFHGPRTAQGGRQGVLCGKSSFRPARGGLQFRIPSGIFHLPRGATFKEIHAVLAEHGSPGWISAEGTNVSPTEHARRAHDGDLSGADV